MLLISQCKIDHARCTVPRPARVKKMRWKMSSPEAKLGLTSPHFHLPSN